ncbi:MAG: M48 family metallopeptidase, partial [Actinomycetia bacterium]|nr:M48 family metallopeptidase [Actinomycetes bacterium]
RRAYFDGAAFYLPASLTAEQIKTHCLRLYRQLARQGLSARLAFYSRLMGVAPQMIRISGAKTRWGSCSARQTISFSWRLIMASAAVQDYVVVHELAHLREMNHSQRFWQIVEDFLPDYPERQRQLRALQRQLTSENWD